ncbi:hypothetical protein BH10CYA1_BH10CYA1_46730 [soil metagenome]
MAPTLNDKTADSTAAKIENHLQHGDGLTSVRDEVERVRKAQGNNFDKDAFKAWTEKVEDKLHKDGILPRLDITYDHDKVGLSGISGDGKFDGKGDLVTKSGNHGRFDFKYDKNGQLTSIKDSKEDVNYKYEDGNWTDCKTDKNAALAVDSRGNLHVMHDNGTETDYRRTGEVTEHDAEGRVTSQIGSAGRERTYEYDDQGNVKTFSQKDKDGNIVSAATRQTDGTYIATSAGADGQMGTQDDEATKLKNIEIDNKENLKITNPDGSYSLERGLGAHLDYDKNDRLTDLQTTNGKKYHYDYNGDGKDPVALSISTKGADGKWGTAEDAGDDKVEQTFKLKNGQITTTDADGKTETYKGSIGIDDRGRALVTNADKEIETTYGLSGAVKVKTHDKVTQVVNPDGTESNFVYDGDKLKQATLFAGTDREQQYVMQDGKWMVKGADGTAKPADITPTVDHFGTVRLTKADADGHFTLYTPMGDVIEGYNEPKLETEAAVPTTAADASQPTDQLPGQFGVKLLEKLNLPVTEENLKFLNAWQHAEGGSADNPFNTTQSAPGAENFNSVGVKRYPSIDVGLDATAQTLTNGQYNNILASLQQGNNASASADALAQSPWGTGALVQQILAG